MVGVAWAMSCDRAVLGADAEAKAPTGKKVVLALKMATGDKVGMDMQVESEVSQNLPGVGEQKIKMSVGFKVGSTVTEVRKDGSLGMDMKYERMQMTQELGGTKMMDVDTEHMTDAPMDKMFKAMIGRNLSMVFRPTGELVELHGASALADAMLKEAPEASRAQMEQMLRKQFSDEAMLTQFKGAMTVYPTRGLDNGDTWDFAGKMGGMVPMNLKTHYTMLDHNGEKASVALAGTIETVEGGEPMSVGGLTMKYGLKGQQTGTLEVNLKTGWVKKLEMKQEVTGTVEASGPGITGTQSWPIVINTHVAVSGE